MALVDMCLQMKMEIGVIHVNYHHRRQAEEEEQYIRAYCLQHDVLLYVQNESFVYEGNFEAMARKWRYDYFVKVAKEYDYKGVLIAHHQDDLIETFIMQEEKNIVPSYYGLKEDTMYQGILVKRPLLGYTKEQLIAYCDSRHIRYYLDHTNQDISLRRNAIRADIVSKMSAMEREMVVHEIAMLNAQKQERICRVGALIQNRKVNVEAYRRMNEIDRLSLLRLVVEPLEFYETRVTLAHLKEMDHVIVSKNDFVIPVHGKWLVKEQGEMFLVKEGKAYADVYQSLDEMIGRQCENYRIEKGNPGIYALSLTEADYPVTIRNAQAGDSIVMRFGNKSVHRFFIDRKIPLYKRKTWPIVCDRDGRVIFVSGLGCDVRHFTVNPDVNVVECTVSEGE